MLYTEPRFYLWPRDESPYCLLPLLQRALPPRAVEPQARSATMRSCVPCFRLRCFRLSGRDLFLDQSCKGLACGARVSCFASRDTVYQLHLNGTTPLVLAQDGVRADTFRRQVPPRCRPPNLI